VTSDWIRSARRCSPTSSTEIERLVEEVQTVFDHRPTDVEAGLDVEDPALLQLRKACRLLAGAAVLEDEGYDTLVIEASFDAIERTVEFRLLERGTTEPDDLPGSHPGVYREAATVGIFSESVAEDLADMWREHRAKTYYRDGLVTTERARKMHELATEIHAFVVGRSAQGHECLCDPRD